MNGKALSMYHCSWNAVGGISLSVTRLANWKGTTRRHHKPNPWDSMNLWDSSFVFVSSSDVQRPTKQRCGSVRRGFHIACDGTRTVTPDSSRIACPDSESRSSHGSEYPYLYASPSVIPLLWNKNQYSVLVETDEVVYGNQPVWFNRWFSDRSEKLINFYILTFAIKHRIQ